MTKELLAQQSWTVRDTEIQYNVYKVLDRDMNWYEVEMLNETFRLRKDASGNWTDLDGAASPDIQKWGEVIEVVTGKPGRL
jgi:hypothetical protein